MNPVFYDFKRSFLRLSVIIFIIIFATLGISASYETYVSTVAPNPYFYHDLNVIGVSITKGDENNIIGYVFNNQGNPISNAEINVNNSIYRTNSSGYFSINVSSNFSKPIIISYNNQKISFEQSSVFGNGTKYLSTVLFTLSTPVTHKLFSLNNDNSVISTSNSNSMASLGLVIVKDTLILVTNNPNNQQVYIQFRSLTSNTSTNGEYIGNVTNYFNFYHIQSPSSEKLLIVTIISNKSLQSTFSSLYYPHGDAITSLVNNIDDVMGIFAIVFPIIMLYLAYVLFSKPRDTGALKFILARPITRRELYINRYLGGVITAVLSSFLLSFLSYITLSVLLLSSGVSLPINIPLLTFAYVTAELIAFFSLVYMLPSFIKSGGTMLGISIFLFLFFEVGINIIAEVMALTTHNISGITNILWEIYYFSPLGVQSYGSYYLERQYGLTSTISTVHLPLVILSTILWIIVPFIVGLIKFNKINI
ncbi:ABC transporter permease subunit [Sulfolobus sp. E5-1-F]|uniref:ABC transporter permease subunit n=1 Tax=Saccharolobus sp. E5-1-F TaxID=2663019 RepID=UPI001295249F|nr:ABC transporter permease subunit [Sulfolobus sp. E5-1-F]QGA53907.1 ABC transporter permease subunit [Sulfolobus sp. E5-1-F]